MDKPTKKTADEVINNSIDALYNAYKSLDKYVTKDVIKEFFVKQGMKLCPEDFRQACLDEATRVAERKTKEAHEAEINRLRVIYENSTLTIKEEHSRLKIAHDQLQNDSFEALALYRGLGDVFSIVRKLWRESND